jgi:hypothetical protein
MSGSKPSRSLAGVTPSSSCWISVGGKFDHELATSIDSRIEALRDRGLWSLDEEAHVSSVSLSTSEGEFRTTPEKLEKLRRLCQIYSVRIRPEAITSHRRFIGPVIVAVKKVLFRVVEGLLGKTIKHQRDFNAEVVSLLTDLCNDARRDR